jgi:hypothetical protein
VPTTTHGDARGIDDLPKWVQRTWTIPLAIGILTLILGLVLLFNINAGIGTLRWLVVISLIFAAVEAFATASLRQKPWVGWLVGFAYVVGRHLEHRLAGRDPARAGHCRRRIIPRRRNHPSGDGLAGKKHGERMGLELRPRTAFGRGRTCVPVRQPHALRGYVIMTGVILIVLALAVRTAATALAGP